MSNERVFRTDVAGRSTDKADEPQVDVHAAMAKMIAGDKSRYESASAKRQRERQAKGQGAPNAAPVEQPGEVDSAKARKYIIARDKARCVTARDKAKARRGR